MMVTEDLYRDFHEAMLAINEVAKEFDPFYYVFRGMVEMDGGVETAKKLVAEPGPQSGLLLLWQQGRLDLSVEAHMLQPRFRSLFTAEELATARRRLENLGYSPEEKARDKRQPQTE